VLARGYAVVTRKDDGSVVSRVAQAQQAQQVSIRVSDGQVDAEIKNRKSQI
jgi:exonuclease VII large subunit